MPFMQGEQARPQAPQFIASTASSASHPSPSSPLQSSKPGWHAVRPQTWFRHSGPARGGNGHAAPQAPQCIGSNRTSTHAKPPSQTTAGGAHAGRHIPIAHSSPGAHGMPQPLQWSTSVIVDTHWPAHSR